MKTAEQILKELCERVTGNVHDYSHSWLLEAMEEYAQQRVEEATRWIPLSERLPEINCCVAVRTKNKVTAIMSFHAHPEEDREFHRWMFGKWQKQTSIVTHWTKIPPLPKAPTV